MKESNIDIPTAIPSHLPLWLENILAENFINRQDFKINYLDAYSKKHIKKDPFAAAIFFMNQGEILKCSQNINKAIKQGFYNDKIFYSLFHEVIQDKDLLKYIEAIKNNRRKLNLHKRLYNLFLSDQADRKNIATSVNNIVARDKERISEVKKVLNNKELNVVEDYYHAAMILHHSSNKEDNLLAYKLCIQAININPYDNPTRWLAAAALDRYLLMLDCPQVFGTQFLILNKSNELSHFNSKTTPEKIKHYWRVPTTKQQEDQILIYNEEIKSLSR